MRFRENTKAIFHNTTFLNRGALWFFLLALLIFSIRAIGGLNLFEFGDETEKFVAAQMISDGMLLYRDVFAHHGPVQYMIAHAYLTFLGPADFSQIRWFMIALALSAVMSIYFSPIFKSQVVRQVASGAFLLALSAVWNLQGIHMVLYHSIGGFLYTVPLMQTGLPLIFGVKPSAFAQALSGFCAVLICFTAYSFGPSVTILGLCAFLSALLFFSQKSTMRMLFFVGLGALLAATCVSLWLQLFADLKGFLVYHFYFNQAVYSSFINFSFLDLGNLFVLSSEPSNIIHSTALLSLLATALLAKSLELPILKIHKRRMAGVACALLGAVSLLFLSPRGARGFQGTAFLIASLGLSAAIFALYIQKQLEREKLAFAAKACALTLTIVFAIFEIVAYKAISTPHGVKKTDFTSYLVSLDRSSDFAFLDYLDVKRRDMLALIFNPALYIKSGRLPASGNYYYLPWQASYNRKPFEDYKIDICEDIERNKPSVIWFDNWRVWCQHAISEYEPCVPSLIEAYYEPMGEGSFYYVRSDKIDSKLSSPMTEQREIKASPPIVAGRPQQLNLLGKRSKTDRFKLKALGLLFGTHNRRNKGEAELTLATIDGKLFKKTFSLADLKDNQYKYIEVPPLEFVEGEIVALSGGGVSLWESHHRYGERLTCIQYFNSDYQVALTPGCR